MGADWVGACLSQLPAALMEAYWQANPRAPRCSVSHITTFAFPPCAPLPPSNSRHGLVDAPLFHVGGVLLPGSMAIGIWMRSPSAVALPPLIMHGHEAASCTQPALDWLHKFRNWGLRNFGMPARGASSQGLGFFLLAEMQPRSEWNFWLLGALTSLQGTPQKAGVHFAPYTLLTWLVSMPIQMPLSALLMVSSRVQDLPRS